MNYYAKVRINIQYETKNGIKMKAQASNVNSLLNLGIEMAFKEHGEEGLRAVVEKQIAAEVEMHRKFEEERNKS